jgi:acyl-coenzyme A thioesterase 13
MDPKESPARYDMVDKTLRIAKGNVSQKTKDMLADWWVKNCQTQGFCGSILAKLEVVEASVFENAEIPSKKDGKIAFEVDVTRGECDGCKLRYLGLR